MADFESRLFLIEAACSYDGTPQSIQLGEDLRVHGLQLYWEMTDLRQRSSAQVRCSASSPLTDACSGMHAYAACMRRLPVLSALNDKHD